MEHKNEGNCYFKNKYFDQAKSCYEKAVSEDPTNIIFYSNLAAVHLEKNDFQECIETCKKAIKVGDENKADGKQLAKVFARMGRAHIRDQNFKVAVNCFESALGHHKLNEYDKILSEAEMFLRLENNPLVEVKQSTVHGRGVFAVKDIKEGEMVCLYDGKLVDSSSLYNLVNKKTPLDKEYWMSHPRDPKLTMCGYKTPKTVLGVAQLVNDYSKPAITEVDFKHGIKACEEYVTLSRQHMNVGFTPDGKDFWLYAGRDIKEGEELFLHYNYKIWLATFRDSLGKETEDAHMWRLLYWAIDGKATALTDGRYELLRFEDACTFEENVCKSVLKSVLRVPDKIMESARRIPAFSHRDLMVAMLEKIEVHRVETFLD